MIFLILYQQLNYVKKTFVYKFGSVTVLLYVGIFTYFTLIEKKTF